MFKHFSFVLFLSLSLCLRPDCIWAGTTDSVDQKLLALNLLHEDLVTGQLAEEQIAKSGKYIADETFKYINDSKNKAKLNSPEGKNLLKHQALLVNYMSIKNHLEKCVAKSENKRDLKKRVLNAALSNVINSQDVSSPCLTPNVNIKSFVDFNNDVMKAMKARTTGDFLNEMNQQVLINSMKSMVGLKYKFDPEFMKQGYLTQNDLNKLMAKICFKNACNKISSEFNRKIATAAINYSKEIKQKETRFTPKTAADSLNKSIDRLNSALNKISVKKDEGIIFDSANLKDPNSKKQFDEYVYSYMHEVSKDAGPLMLTKTMREEAGEIKSFSEDDTKKDSRTSQFKFVPHKKIKESDVKDAIEEAEEKIYESAKDAEKIVTKESYRKSPNIKYRNYVDSGRKDDISEMVKINPFAVGQILVRNPELAGHACDAINQINKTDEKDAKFDKYFMIGGAILGGALLLTGVGTVVGAYMITGSLTAGVAAGTVGGTIMSSTMIAGAVTESASAAYFGKKSYDSYVETGKIESAIFSNNGDNQSILEKKEAYLGFKEARTKAIVSLAGAAFSGVRIDKFFNLSRLVSNGLKLSEMKATTKIMEALADSKIASKIADTAKLLGGKGAELMDEFLVRLAKAGEKVRLSALEALKDSRITPDKLNEIIKTSLEAAKKCVKV